MIEQLELLAANEGASWFKLSYEDQETFSKEFAAFVDTNLSEAEAYLLKQDSALFDLSTIIFDAISRFSNHPEILLPLAKKVLDFPYGKEEDDLYNLEVLDDIDTIELFERSPAIYMQYLDLLCSHLVPEKDPQYLLRLLPVFDLAFVQPETASENQFIRKKWFDTIADLANDAPLKVKLAARKILASNKQTRDLQPLSLVEKIRALIGL